MLQRDPTPSKIEAPWTEAQVRQLNVFQHDATVDPFTSSRDEHGNDAPQVILVATVAGWVRQEGGPVICDWAWAYMAKVAFLEARHRLPIVWLNEIDIRRLLEKGVPYV